MFQKRVESLQHIQQLFRQTVTAFLFEFFRDPIKSFCNGTGDTGQRVAIAAQRYCGTDYIFKRLSLQKCSDCFRDSFLAGFHMMVMGADLIASAAEIIVELILNIGLDLWLAEAGTGQENSCRGCLRSFDALGMVVCYFCGKSSHMTHQA